MSTILRRARVPALLAIAAWAACADLPKDAESAIANFEKKSGRIAAEAGKDKAKLRKALLQEIEKAEQREDRAKQYAAARALREARKDLEAEDAACAKEDGK